MKPCMDSLKNQTLLDFEVIVVDNGSTDGSVAYIEEVYPEINLIKLNENTGFSKAVNVGIKASRAPFVLLLNNDTKCCKDFVAQLYRAIYKNRRIFSVSSKMIKMHDHTKIDSAGDQYNVIGWAFNRGSGKNVENYNEAKSIFTACAGAAIYRRSIFQKIGYFDEAFFAYREDIDIGYRAKIHGYLNLYCPKAKVYHVGSGTSGSTHNAFKVKLGVRNNIYMNYKNMPLFFLLLNLPFLVAGYLVKFLFFLKKGFGKEYISGVIEGLTKAHKLQKTKFLWKHLGNYIGIQLELYKNTFSYLLELKK